MYNTYQDIYVILFTESYDQYDVLIPYPVEDLYENIVAKFDIFPEKLTRSEFLKLGNSLYDETPIKIYSYTIHDTYQIYEQPTTPTSVHDIYTRKLPEILSLEDWVNKHKI